MTGGSNKAALGHIGFISLFTRQLLFRQGISELLGTIPNPGFQHCFIFTEGSNISKGRDETTTFNWITPHLNHAAIFTDPFKFMRTTNLHPVNPFTHMFFNRTRTAFTAFSVITDQISNRATDINNIFWVVEQFQILVVPGDQTHVFINHTHPLGHMVDHGHDQVLVKTLPL